MAQEVLCKKLGESTGEQEKEKQARDHMIKLFDGPLPDDAMEDIEDLLKVIRLEGKKPTITKNGGKKAAISLKECLTS
jgi:hypothetical protein